MANPRIPYQLSDQLRPLPPLNGRPVIVHVVVNVEHWSFDEPMPRKLLGSPHGRDNVPDIPNFSWVEYGMRAGLPRVVHALSSRGIPASASVNASVIEAYAPATELIATAGWEFIAHGVTQRALPGSADEAAVVHEALEALERFTGRRPRGWLGPGLAETADTPDVLSAAGLDYLCDWVVDDVPLWLDASPRPLVAVPYTLELNDSLLFAVQWHPASEYEQRVATTLAWAEAESERSAVVLTLALHPHLIGVPHRFAVFERILERLQSSPMTVFATGEQICDWFAAARPQSGLPKADKRTLT